MLAKRGGRRLKGRALVQKITQERAQQMLASLTERKTTSSSTIRAFRLLGNDFTKAQKQSNGKNTKKDANYPEFPRLSASIPNGTGPSPAGMVSPPIDYSPRLKNRSILKSESMPYDEDGFLLDNSIIRHTSPWIHSTAPVGAFDTIEAPEGITTSDSYIDESVPLRSPAFGPDAAAAKREKDAKWGQEMRKRQRMNRVGANSNAFLL